MFSDPPSLASKPLNHRIKNIPPPPPLKKNEGGLMKKIPWENHDLVGTRTMGESGSLRARMFHLKEP